MLIWGMSFICTNIVLKYYSPITIISLRLVISSLLLFFIIYLMGRKQKIKKKDMKLLLLSALFQPFLYFIGETFGLELVSPTISAVIIGTIPVFTPIAAYFLLHEKLSKLNIAGFAISFIGILVMIFKKDFSLSTDPKGIAFLGLAVFGAVGYGMVIKNLANKYDSLTIVANQNLIGAFMFLPIFFIFDFKEFLTVQIEPELILNLLLLAVFGSTLAFIFYTTVVREIGVSKSVIFTNTIPVFTAIFSYLILSEIFTETKILGMIIVIAGVFLSQINNKSRIYIFGKQLWKRKSQGQ